jgi:Tfp pilus assembly protein PilN
MNTAELQAVQAAANEANAMIDRRTFSWTELFNHVEATLPRGVMLTAIRPTIDEGDIKLTMAVIGRTVADIDAFMERLEETSAFADLLSTDEQAMEEGTLRVTLVGRFIPVEQRRARPTMRPARGEER